MFSSLQKIALLLGFPLLYLVGMRLQKGEGRYVVRDSAGAFVVLCVVVAALLGALWSELGLLWPVAVAVPYLALLASALFQNGLPQKSDSQTPAAATQEEGSKPEV